MTQEKKHEHDVDPMCICGYDGSLDPKCPSHFPASASPAPHPQPEEEPTKKYKSMSDFFRNASPEEQMEVARRAALGANEDQRQLMERAHPQPVRESWEKHDKMKQFLSVLTTRDNYVCLHIETAKSILPMAREAIRQTIHEEVEGAEKRAMKEMAYTVSASLDDDYVIDSHCKRLLRLAMKEYISSTPPSKLTS